MSEFSRGAVDAAAGATEATEKAAGGAPELDNAETSSPPPPPPPPPSSPPPQATRKQKHQQHKPASLRHPSLSVRTGAAALQADMQYLVRHDVARTLETLTRGLLGGKPDSPVGAIIRALKEMRIRARAKQIETYLGHATLGMDEDAKGEVGRQVGAIVSLERDDSIKSGCSTFSINSTDMAEFIGDIHDAYTQLSRSRVLNGRISKTDLGDIIDLIAYPIPEKILSDMFLEVDTDNEGTVDYLECVAKMTYRIQGRYHLEALRPIYTTSLSLLQQQLDDGSASAAAATATATAAATTTASSTTAGPDGADDPAGTNSTSAEAAAAAAAAASAAVEGENSSCEEAVSNASSPGGAGGGRGGGSGGEQGLGLGKGNLLAALPVSHLQTTLRRLGIGVPADELKRLVAAAAAAPCEDALAATSDSGYTSGGVLGQTSSSSSSSDSLTIGIPGAQHSLKGSSKYVPFSQFVAVVNAVTKSAAQGSNTDDYY